MIKEMVGKGTKALVYCPICTHTVEAEVNVMGRKAQVVPGQRCRRCSTAIDAGIVVQLLEAA